MESSKKKHARIATPMIVETKKQNDNANNLIPKEKKRKWKENSCSKTKTILKQENVEVPSLMSEITIIGDSILKQKKRTLVRRRRHTETSEPMRRQANAAERVFLPLEEPNERPKVRLPIPPFQNNNELIIRPKEENDPIDHSNDETKKKRRRGSSSKHQVATPRSPSTRRRKTSLSRKVHHGVDQSGRTHQTPRDKNEPKQLDSRPQPQPRLPLPSPPPGLPPPPHPWPAMSPDWLQSEPYNQPFTNVGTSSNTNGADYKEKKFVVDDEYDKGKKPSLENNLDFLFRTPKGGIKIDGGLNGNTNTDKESIPSRDRDFFRDFINEVNGEKTNPIPTHVSPSTYLRPAATKRGRGPGPSTVGGGAASSVHSPPLTQPPLPWGGQSRVTRDFTTRVHETPEPPPRRAVPDSHDVSIQGHAEGIFGKQAFANGVPPLAGPLTAMMILSIKPGSHEATSALTFFRNHPPHSPSTTTTTTTTTHSRQFLPPPISEPNLVCHNNTWTPPTNDSLFVHHPETYETTTYQPLPAQQARPQFVTNPFLVNNDVFQQQQSNVLFMPAPQMATAFGVPNFPGQYLLQGYAVSSSSGDGGNWVMGNWGYQGHLPPPPPPPGF